ncbi:MAG: InlB B-repeat-containing protein [Chitinispirillales bacterium]|jgi:hypothetical protein|nr:InlB B-repeat-containing protein [Chitinispirillales bacterium]
MSATKALKAMAIFAVFAATAAAQIKYVAVVESEIDAASGASADITSADVRQVTSALRREAVKNLPPDKYNIMTTETVLSQGSAKLEECADENCVITLGAKIGADYIVRGIISKLRARFTLSVEVYETDNGNLVASSAPVRSESVEDLVDKAAAVCAEMFDKFASAESSRRKSAEMYAIVVRANPPKGGSVVRDPDLDEYKQGTTVKVTAKPAEGYVFAGWAGAVTDTASTVFIKMDDNKMLVAKFKLPSKDAVLQGHALVTSAYPPEGGSVARSPDKEEGYAPGELVTLTASAERGYKFTGWSAAGGKNKLKLTKGGRDVTVTMDGDKALAANFDRIKFDYYIAPKYEFPLGIGTPVSWGSAYIEGGLIWGEGAFFGIDIGGGAGTEYSSDNDALLGFGLNLGNTHDWGNRKQFVYGVSAGLWMVTDRKEGGGADEYTNFLALFVKLRERFVELTYREFLGIHISDNHSFKYTQHQLMIGFYFASSKRWKP